jgi:hypothetical protein
MLSSFISITETKTTTKSDSKPISQLWKNNELITTIKDAKHYLI